MSHIEDLVENVPAARRQALLWFVRNQGAEVSLPGPLPDGTLLATRAKGIYKPKGSPHALSVRTNIESPYLDGKPERDSTGAWTMRYAQEGRNPRERDRAFTNRALVQCQQDGVPVGVLLQVARRPRPRYKVEGLALVTGWEEGFFLLKGVLPDENAPAPTQMAELIEAHQIQAAGLGAFSVHDLSDARERLAASIVRRRGQPDFRQKLLDAYGGRCAVTGCAVEEVLEACHIVPYRGPATNHPANGLLLRADLHALFDLGLLAFDSVTGGVLLARRLNESDYRSLEGATLRAPADDALRPSAEALDYQRSRTGL